MFSIPRVNVIQSDDGFSIEVLGRVGIKYREGEGSLFVDSEVLVPGKGILIITKSIRQWDPPYDGEPITAAKKSAIVENIKRAMLFKKEPLEIV